MSTVAVPALGGARAWFNWVIGVSFVVVVFIMQTGYAITNIQVSKDLGLTIAQVGFIGSVYTWVFAVTQFASGAILDRLGAQRVLPIACGLVTLGAFLFAHAEGPLVLICAQVLLAIGASFGFIGAGFVGGQWFEPLKYGFMFALVQLVASLSAVAGQRTLNVLIVDYRWDTIINGIGFMGVAVVALMLIFLRDPLGAETTRKGWTGIKAFTEDLIQAVNQVTAIKDCWINALIGGATFGTMLAIGVIWGPRLLVAGGMEQADANATTSMSWFGLALGAPAFAWFSDKLRKRRLAMAIGCALQLAVIVIAMTQTGMPVEFASIIFFLWGFMAGASMLPYAIAAELVPASLIGTSAAIVNAVQFIVGGIMMAIPGRVLSGTGLIARIAEIEGNSPGSTSDYRWAIVVYPMVLGLALIMHLFLRETYPSGANGK
ncbi:MAG: MFS transporter [Gammaproteobacteria bacterium]|nr:MFS transporter [Gammaproteobacteria bacterium]